MSIKRSTLLKLWAFLVIIAGAFLLVVSPASAATCAPATSPGAAPASWQTYCWLDLIDYNHAAATAAAGQNFSVTLSDGSVLTFNLKTAGGGVNAIAAPSWTGAAVGNSSFLDIPGQPIIYSTTGGTLVTLTFSNIAVAPPPGVATVTNYAFVAASGESTHGTEYLEYTTNGAAWEVLDEVPPITGSRLPGKTGEGTSTFRETGDGLNDDVGAYIVGTDTPTTVTASMQSGGLQGMMFAVRFASITLSKTIGGARISANDQFDFGIESTSSGSTFASGTTTGTGLGPFPAAVLSTASGIPITLNESMASGSDNAIAKYQSVLTCTNAASGSSTVMPSGVVTTSYDFGALQFGDVVSCDFVNTPFPHVSLTKMLGPGGRVLDTDQFRLRIRDRTDGFNISQINTTGTGSSFIVDSTGQHQVTAGNTIRVIEAARGTTDFGLYVEETVCTNANTYSTTVLATGGRRVDFVPVLGDVITCIVTNSRDVADATLLVEKTSTIIFDPTGSANPKAIPLAIVEYTITVTNVGEGPVDDDTLAMLDLFPVAGALQTTFPVTFAEGATASGLDTFNAATMVSCSEESGGVAPYSYNPTGTFDPDVTGILIEPEGAMAASDGTNHPSFTITYRMQIK